MSYNTISVIGLGYIGLPTAAMFAAKKKKVIGVDINQDAVNIINQGKIHIVEPELDILVQAAVSQGYLHATTIIAPADVFLIAVPTPFKDSIAGEIPEPDLSYIEAAAKAISAVLKKGDLVILESTSPVGATEKLATWLSEACPQLSFPLNSNTIADVNVAYCPERVLPGHVVRELIENDRVIGGLSPECSAKAVELYSTFVEGECVVTNSRTAEMAKLTENSSRDVQIAFANELSMICDKLDINIWELIELANRHPRVNILQPGPGVGGHCIAVDPWFIVSKTPEEARLIYTARKVNDSKPNWVVDKVKQAIAEHLQLHPNKTVKDMTIACYGLAFKPNIDDLRESPALEITKNIASMHNGTVIAVEPNISSFSDMENHVEFFDWCGELPVADIHLMLVDHVQFKELRPRTGIVIDTRGIW